MSRHPKTDLYRAEREKGMTYQQIADKYGVSRQCIAQACGKQRVARFRYNNSCIYLGLRRWMNDNKVNLSELLRRMDLLPIAENYIRYRQILCGKTEPKKSFIDFMIKLTGMTYEELFQEVDNGQE